jgi:hypothetical protein
MNLEWDSLADTPQDFTKTIACYAAADWKEFGHESVKAASEFRRIQIQIRPNYGRK